MATKFTGVLFLFKSCRTISRNALLLDYGIKHSCNYTSVCEHCIHQYSAHYTLSLPIEGQIFEEENHFSLQNVYSKSHKKGLQCLKQQKFSLT